MIVLYGASGICTTNYDPESRVILAIWHELAGHDHVKPCVSTHFEAVKNGARILIVDVSNTTCVPSQEEQAWCDVARPGAGPLH